MDELKIENKKVTKKHIGAPVTYIPTHAEGNANHKDTQQGHITSASDLFVFVRFNGSTSQACRTEDLVWG